jgi:glycosyltransferase involved in cell wall biosynthesis
VKVLIIVTAYPRSAGDVITPWLTEAIRRLRAVGVQVEVLAPAYRGSGDQVVEGVRVHRFRYAPASWETLTHDQTAPDRLRERPWYLALVPLYMAAGISAARRLGRSGEFDVIHAFWPIPHGVLGVAAKRAGGVPLVSTFFGVELTWLETQLAFLTPVLRWIVRRSDAVTAISAYTAGKLLSLAPATEVEIVPFGAAVDPGRVSPSLPEPSSGPRDRYELLFVGRLVERKGVQHLLEALALLRQRGRAVSLRVVGDGPFLTLLRRRAAELKMEQFVTFEGKIPDDALARRFATCDAFVLPAVTDAKGDIEGLGVVLIEALQYGRPVIASGAGGITDIVRHGETGLLVPPGEPEALANAVIEYMDDPALARRMAEAGRSDVAARFGWPIIIGKLRDLYHRVDLGRREISPGAAREAQSVRMGSSGSARPDG